MKLHSLSNNPGAKKRRKRVGCGEGSGHGKTSGRGHKGMKARSGGGVRPGFEGGQMPLYRKLPHRGFNNYNVRKVYATVNVADLEKLDGAVDAAVLEKAGLIRCADCCVKVLGDGALTKALTVSAHKFSAGAKAKIEKAGGKVVVLACEDAAEKPAKDANA